MQRNTALRQPDRVGTSLRQRIGIALRWSWASPCSLLGFALGLPVLAIGGSARRAGRTLEIARHRGACPASSPWARLPFSAITFGHVVIGVSRHDLDRLRAHEQVHVRQYEQLGPLFLLAYPASSLLAVLGGGCPYRDNRFEVQAHREAPAAVAAR